MPQIRIAGTGDRFLNDGKPFFYLADTVWSAFTNPTLEEWEYYLGYRRNQGFNVLQINIMPQGDRSENPWNASMPFKQLENGWFDFNEVNPAYFERAAKMTAMAVERGFVSALVLLWGDRVFGTWSNIAFKTQAMPLDFVPSYVRLVVDTFARFNPIWLVSGDTDLPDVSKPWFKTALDLLRELTPDLLCAFHMDARQPLPEEWPDFYLTYSGHARDEQDQAYKQAERFWSDKIRRPMINGEPCYEAHRQSSDGGRFSRFEVRRTAWWSLLSGAKAGIAYGGHGVWSWHRKGMYFCNEKYAGIPLDWRNALTLPAAWDLGFARKLFELYRLAEMNPRQDLLVGALEAVRLSAEEDSSRFAIYVPYTRAVTLRLDLSRYNLIAVNLEERRFEHPEVVSGVEESTIAMAQSNADMLIIGERE